jgi:hypothetical protein
MRQNETALCTLANSHVFKALLDLVLMPLRYGAFSMLFNAGHTFSNNWG